MAATPAKLNTPFKSGKIKGMSGGSSSDSKMPKVKSSK